ncbi:hypothetical protein MBRA_05856 [Methylobacterium brachiatum]|nr:hypothetical protein MBRA_05856 [Methylobacterium brachiatum]
MKAWWNWPSRASDQQLISDDTGRLAGGSSFVEVDAAVPSETLRTFISPCMLTTVFGG